MADSQSQRTTTYPEQIKTCILKTYEPLVIKNVLSWSLLSWTAKDWMETLGNVKLDVRIGSKLCTKVAQWEADCAVATASLQDMFDADSHKANDTWMYFDYKHLRHHFNNNTDMMKSVSWADFGFADKGGVDSTIWIGTAGAYTPCHMDSYGCNIVAQVYGRKLWVMFPPNKTPLMKPRRIPYEESSVFSGLHMTCGLNVNTDMEGAHVVELSPGDVLVVPRHWWHYVENLTTAISINMWIPLGSDDASRLDEALVRFFVSSMLKATSTEGGSRLLNPNEADLIEEPVDVQQLAWCLDQVTRSTDLSRDNSCLATCVSVMPSMSADQLQETKNAESSTDNSCLPKSVSAVPSMSADQIQVTKSAELSTDNTCLPKSVSAVPSMSANQLQRLLLTKCGCDIDSGVQPQTPQPLTLEHVINAFCHPDVIAKVSHILLSSKK